MREIRTSGSMSGDGKRGRYFVAIAPALDSTCRSECQVKALTVAAHSFGDEVSYCSRFGWMKYSKQKESSDLR